MMVGGMVGLERTLVPLVGAEEFQVQSDVILFSFIIAFGVVKAFTNLISGVVVWARMERYISLSVTIVTVYYLPTRYFRAIIFL